MKRALRICLKDESHVDLELSKATQIRTDGKMLHLDGLPDGTWRLLFSSDVAEDFSQIDRFEIIRE